MQRRIGGRHATPPRAHGDRFVDSRGAEAGRQFELRRIGERQEQARDAARGRLLGELQRLLQDLVLGQRVGALRKFEQALHAVLFTFVAFMRTSLCRNVAYGEHALCRRAL